MAQGNPITSFRSLALMSAGSKMLPVLSLKMWERPSAVTGTAMQRPHKGLGLSTGASARF